MDDAVQALRDWLSEYWDQQDLSRALTRWSVTAVYAPNKAAYFLGSLESLVGVADLPAHLAQVGIRDVTWFHDLVKALRTACDDPRVSEEDIQRALHGTL